MISSYQEYKEYVEADKRASHIKSFKQKITVTWKYLYCLRKVEYLKNCHPFLWKMRLILKKVHLYRLSVKSGITIGPNVFGKGLYIPHHGCIIVNDTARFGENCVIQCGVNVSSEVTGGNHIYFGAGAKVVSGVNIPDDVIIAANAVVTENIEEENIVVGGVPAKQISKNGFKNRTKV